MDLQNPDPARSEKRIRSANSTVSAGANRSTRAHLKKNSDWIFRTKSAWNHRNRARRNVVAFLTASANFAIAHFPDGETLVSYSPALDCVLNE